MVGSFVNIFVKDNFVQNWRNASFLLFEDLLEQFESVPIKISVFSTRF